MARVCDVCLVHGHVLRLYLYKVIARCQAMGFLDVRVWFVALIGRAVGPASLGGLWLAGRRDRAGCSGTANDAISLPLAFAKAEVA